MHRIAGRTSSSRLAWRVAIATVLTAGMGFGLAFDIDQLWSEQRWNKNDHNHLCMWEFKAHGVTLSCYLTSLEPFRFLSSHPSLLLPLSLVLTQAVNLCQGRSASDWKLVYWNASSRKNIAHRKLECQGGRWGENYWPWCASFLCKLHFVV